MTEYGFYIGEEASFDHGLLFSEHPVFEYGEEVVDLIEVPGSQGSLVERTGVYSDTVITNVMEFRAGTENFDMDLIQEKKWISSAQKVRYTEMPEIFFKVKKVAFEDEEEISRWSKKITVVFTCEPGIYLLEGQKEITGKMEIENQYSVSCPIYKIAGEGRCVLSVNENQVTANIGQNLIIDTEKMMAYRMDGTMQDTEIDQDYEKLYLKEGTNTLSVSQEFVLTIIPNWRWLM